MYYRIVNAFIKLFVIFLFLAGTSLFSSAASPFPSPEKLEYPRLQFSPPPVKRIVLQNGMIIYFLEDRELPLVSVNALVRTGTILDPEGKEGLAELTSSVIKTGGTKKVSSEKIDNNFDFIASSPSVSTGPDSVQISFSFFKKDIDLALDLMSQIMIDPAFEQNKVMTAKNLKLEELRRLKDDPQKLAIREFNKIIYRKRNFGRFPSLDSIKQIERDDLIKFHDMFFQPQNIMLAVTGDLTEQEAIDKIDKYFGNWRKERDIASPIFDFSPPPSGLYYINREIPQATIISGQFCPGKNHPDYYGFAVLDFIIGSGGFPSRIFSAVRNNEGLAYSAGSFYRPRVDHGVFASYAFTKTETTLKTFFLIDSVKEDIRNKTITDAELDWAKKSINNGFIFSFTSPEQIAWQQMKTDYDRLPADFLINYRKRIESITIDDLNKVAEKYLRRENNVTVILGYTAKFGQLPEALGSPILINPED